MKCPTCGKEAPWSDNPNRPFCSERCKLIDLGRWVNEEYRVPGAPVPDTEREKKEIESDDSLDRDN